MGDYTYLTMKRSLAITTGLVALVTLASSGLAGCVSVAGTIASSVASAAIKTAIEQAEKNRPTPEELWQDAQMASLERRAIGGELEAQYQLGTYYLAVHEPAAADWICQAANMGHPKAQLQYGHFFNEDRKHEDLYPFLSIRPNNVEAFVWYSLATRHGEPRAGHFRDSLMSGALNANRLRQAETQLASWQPINCGEVRAATVVARVPASTQR